MSTLKNVIILLVCEPVILISQLTSHQAKISNQECVKCRECPHCSGGMFYFWQRGWWLIINFPVAWKRMNDLSWNNGINETTQPLHHGLKSKICVVIKTVCDKHMYVFVITMRSMWLMDVGLCVSGLRKRNGTNISSLPKQSQKNTKSAALSAS